MSHICVPVVDQERTPLMSTTPARARRWIRSGKATHFWKGGMFCVRLNVQPSAREQQPIAVGIDPGSKREGIVVASASHTYLNIQAEARTGVKEAEKDTHAPPQSQDPVPQAAPEPQAEQEEAAALHQGTLAVETALGHLSLPDLSSECLRG